MNQKLLVLLMLTIFFLGTVVAPESFACSKGSKFAEVKTYIGLMSKSQREYFLAHSHFAKSWSELGLDIPNRTNYYQYQVEISNDSVFNSGTYIGSGQPCDTKCEVGILAGLFGFCFDSCCSPLFCFISRKECFYHVTGVVYSAVQSNQKTDLLTLVCIDNTQEKKMPILVNRKYVCSPGSSPLL